MPSRKKRASGRLAPPLDVNSKDKIGMFESIAKKQDTPILIFVYADWCGHCQRYKPTWEKLTKDPNRSINMAAVRDDMLPQTSLSQRAEPISSYPTILLIGKNGKAVNFESPGGLSQEVPDHGNEANMRAIIRNAGNEPLLSGSIANNNNTTRKRGNNNNRNISAVANVTAKEGQVATQIEGEVEVKGQGLTQEQTQEQTQENYVVSPITTTTDTQPSRSIPYKNIVKGSVNVAATDKGLNSWQNITHVPDPAADVVRTRNLQAGGDGGARAVRGSAGGCGGIDAGVCQGAFPVAEEQG